MSVGDPDIAALALRLGLRGLQYRSFVRLPAGTRTHAAADMVSELAPDSIPALPELPPAHATMEPSAAPLATGPYLTAPPPVAAPAITAASSMPMPQPVAPPRFPLLDEALARAAGPSVPDPVPDAARPFAALRFAVAGRTDAAGP